jgi:predicted nucleic acid-binding protein
MRYVVDTSVAFKWEVTEPDSDKAIRLRDDYRNGTHELIAPDLFPTEIANALLVAERRGRIVPGLFPTLLVDVLKTCPQLYPARPLLPRVVAIVTSARVSVYDALYVALAEQEMCELLTADDRLARSLPSHPIVLLSTLP